MRLYIIIDKKFHEDPNNLLTVHGAIFAESPEAVADMLKGNLIQEPENHQYWLSIPRSVFSLPMLKDKHDYADYRVYEICGMKFKIYREEEELLLELIQIPFAVAKEKVKA
ncbi:MAG: hypothetical protein WC460_00600 [Patescibacteria group bacterium]